MLNRALYPLRTLVGPAVPVVAAHSGAGISVLRQSASLTRLDVEYRFKARPDLLPALDDPDYQQYFPEYVSGQRRLIPGSGVSNMPPPPDLPFPAQDGVISLMALAKDPGDAPAASLEVTLSIKLRQKALVGGIVYGGHPFIPSVIERSGESAANFGLPREWRLSPSGVSSDPAGTSANGAFLDAETFVTRQELLSHSGVHFLSCDPTYTDVVSLTLSNWPRFTERIQGERMATRPGRNRYGFLIPYFYVFEYQEGTRYHPSVPFGLLTARPNPKPGSDPQPDGENLELILERKGRYFPLSPSSLTNGPRTYEIPSDAQFGGATLKEAYVSNPLAKDKETILFLEQAQEFSRCLSGLRVMAFSVPASELKKDPGAAGNRIGRILPPFHLDHPPANPELLSDLGVSPKVGIRVWEIDPPEGIAPTQVEPGSKYSLLLADHEPSTLEETLGANQSGIRFRRPSSARYLAIEFINREDDNRRLVVPSLSLVQSANVAVSARPSRFQRIRSLNFRLIGDTLGEDLSSIGSDGFHFAVEHWAAGERKAILFQAMSVFDLIHAGVGRLHVNGRRRAAEFETSEYGPGIDKKLGDNRANFDDRTSKNLSNSWHRSEMGNQVRWNGDADIGPDQNRNFDDRSDFVSVSNQEIRTFLRYLYPDASRAEWNSAAIFANLLAGVFRPADVITGTNPVVPTYDAGSHQGKQELVNGFERAWAGLSNAELKKLEVTGTTSIVQSPYCLTAVAGDQVQSFVGAVTGGVQVIADAMNGTFDPAALATTLIDAGNVSGFAALLAASLVPGNPLQTVLATALALNGLTINVSATAAGLGATFGSAPGNLLPVVTESATVGDQGTITKQAIRSNFSYSQTLATSGDNSQSSVYPQKGLMKREVIRAEVRDNQSRVRGAEVAWQDNVTDVISGVIPLDVLLPGLATKGAFRTSDESIRIRLGSGVGTSISVDFWFDVIEEMVRDDY